MLWILGIIGLVIGFNRARRKRLLSEQNQPPRSRH